MPLIDPDLVDELKRSKQLVGELFPVLENQDDEIAAGNHRKKAGWKWVKKIRTRDRLHFLMVKQAAMIQHKNSEQDHIDILREMCEYVIDKLGIPKQKAGKYVIEHCNALKKSYAYALIPNEYKLEYSREKIPALESSMTNVQTIDGVNVRIRTDADEDEDFIERPALICPKCDTQLLLINGKLKLGD